MDDAKPNQERKFWQGPLKHMSLGGGLAAAMLTLTPMKRFFFTREEGVAQTAQIEELKSIVKDGFARQESMLFAHSSDEAHKHERMVDTFRDELKSEKEDRIREITIVESLFKIKHTQTN